VQNKRYKKLADQERESNSRIRLFIPSWRNYFTVLIHPSVALFVIKRPGSGLWAFLFAVLEDSPTKHRLPKFVGKGERKDWNYG